MYYFEPLNAECPAGREIERLPYIQLWVLHLRLTSIPGVRVRRWFEMTEALIRRVDAAYTLQLDEGRRTVAYCGVLTGWAQLAHYRIYRQLLPRNGKRVKRYVALNVFG